jgi:hypothetical protein
MSSAFSPDFPWEKYALPWALTTIIQAAAAMPESDDLGHGCVCARGAVAGTFLVNGTSGTVRIRSA